MLADNPIQVIFLGVFKINVSFSMIKAKPVTGWMGVEVFGVMASFSFLLAQICSINLYSGPIKLQSFYSTSCM